MPTTAQFPSETFPGFTPVRLEVPDGWSPLVIPDAPLALVKDTPAGTFRPNVVVAITRYPNSVTIEQLAAAVVAKTEAIETYAEAGRELRQVDGQPAFRIEGSFSSEQAGTLYQTVWLVRLDRGPFVEAVQITGTCSGDQAESTVLELRAISSSAQFD